MLISTTGKKADSVVLPMLKTNVLKEESISSFEIEILGHGDSFTEWNRFVDTSSQGSIFCCSWWLKAVCPNGFEILTLRRGDRIVAGMPMPIYDNRGHTKIIMPQLTQVLGVLLAPQTSGNYERNLSNDMSILNALVRAIPQFDVFSMRFHYNFTNWLPFYWAGYKQTTRYTYIIENICDIETVFKNFHYSKKKNIKRAESMVTVKYDLSAKDFYENHKMTLAKQGRKIAYSYSLFNRIYDAVYKNNAGRTIYCTDMENYIHSALFVIWDGHSAYDLISTIDPDFRNSGSASLLIMEIIKYLSGKTEKFDFEGSMIENVELSFRRFGARQVPYFTISKDQRNYFIKAVMGVRPMAGRLARKLRFRR